MKVDITSAICNYNHGTYLQGAVQAMAVQEADLEQLIVIDDSSTDASPKILDLLKQQYPFLEVYENQTNQGVNYSTNRVLELSRCSHVYLGGADDLVLPGIYERSLALLSKYPQAGLCCGQAVWYYEQEDRKVCSGWGMPREDCYLSPQQCVELAKEGRLELTGHTCVYNKSAFMDFGGFRVNLKWHADWMVMFALAFRYGICWVARPQAVMRVASSTYSARGIQKKAEQREVMSNMLLFLEEPGLEDIKEAFIQSSALFVFDSDLRPLLLEDRRNWRYFSSSYLLKWVRKYINFYFIISIIWIVPAFYKKYRQLDKGISANTQTPISLDLSSMHGNRELPHPSEN